LDELWNGSMGWYVSITKFIFTLITSYIISIEVVDIYFSTLLQLHCGNVTTLYPRTEYLFAVNQGV
jgi:hypothetical protein